MSDNLSMIFHLFMLNGIKVNLVEASAVSIDVCVDDERPKVETLLSSLKDDYSTIYNENAELLSIRHYNQEAIDRITKDRDILIQQRTRSTVRFVVKKN
jgi:aspartate kinase